MSDNLMSLADLATLNDANLAQLDITNLLQDAPVLAALNAKVASNGTVHKYFATTTAPLVAFRAVNAGRDHDSTTRSESTVDLKVLDCSFTVDTAITNGATRGPEEIIRMEAMEHLRAGMFMLELQIMNGTVNLGQSTGFAGLAPGSTTVQVLGGGSTALTSVYAIRTGDNDVSVVLGNDGRIDVGQSAIQRVTAAGGGYFNAWCTMIQAWYGIQIGSLYSSGRLSNIDAGSNKLTDDKIYSLLEKFPSSRQPDMLIMNRRSLEQLRASRTATNATGADAPRPTEIEGIPIIVTDALGITETAVT